MTVPTGETLFAYPTTRHERRHGPQGYTDYASYKPWLRDEFAFCCVYCTFRERWYPNGDAAFAIDHVEPQARAPHRVCDYDNFVYACTGCNSAKRHKPLPDPCSVAFGEHLRVRVDGTVQPLTSEGERMADILSLGRHDTFRAKLLTLLQRIRNAKKGRA